MANSGWNDSIRYSPLAIRLTSASRLQGALHTGVDRVERCRATDVKPVPLLAAKTEIGDGFGYVDLAEQLAVFGVAAHPVGNAGFWHFRKHLAVRNLAGRHIHIERADMRRVVRPVREAGVE